MLKIVLLSALIIFGVTICRAQDEKNNQSKIDVPDSLKESLAKRRIKQDEEDFQELIQRCEEAIVLTEELNNSYVVNKRFSSEDRKKIEKLEKVVKKIRRDLGAEDEKGEKNDLVPNTPPKTLNSIKEKAANMLDELKKTGRFAISVVAVESSNSIFRLIKFLRFDKN